MQIRLNGKQCAVDSSLNLEQLVEQLELTGKRIAIEVNDELIPRGEHASHLLAENDRVEIVQAIGGG